MKAKVLAFVALIAGGTLLSCFALPRAPEVSATGAAALALVPETLGGRGIAERWNNDLGGRKLEQGALYAASAAGPAVQLDFFRNSPARHDGAFCYMIQGESVIRQQLELLPTAQGLAQFDVALLRGRDQIRIVAATDCGARACAESIPGDQDLHAQLPSQPSWGWQTSRAWSVVPVSVVLVRPISGTDDEPAVAASLVRDLDTTLLQIDLSPAKRLAALQAGR